MNYPFFIYSPGGNLTALIETDTPLDFAAVAVQVIKKHPEVEQVGFIMPARLPEADFHLEMMGGEFCGNASRSAALHWSLFNKKKSAIFTVSGFAVPISAHVQEDTVTARIPGEFLRTFKKVPGGWLADFYGIRFFVTQEALSKEEIEGMVSRYKDAKTAVGVIILQTSAQGHSITPWVWVKSTDTFIQETACASGSIAASLTLRHLGLEVPSYSIIQPSGSVLSVGIEPQFLDMTLSGIVKPVSQGVLKNL